MRMVPAARLELARADAPRILSPLCLPFHHAGEIVSIVLHRHLILSKQNFINLKKNSKGLFLKTY